MFSRLLLPDDPGPHHSLFARIHVYGLCRDFVQRPRLLLRNAGSKISLLRLVLEEFWGSEEKRGQAGSNPNA